MSDIENTTVPLAIIGVSCRLPGAKNVDEYWNLVESGRDATGPLPADVLDRELYYDPERGVRGKSYTSVGGLIPRLPFDNSKCRLPADEIANYDVTHLTMCEVASEALRDAGLDPFDLPNKNVGGYFGHTGGSNVPGEVMYAIYIEQTAHYINKLKSLAHLSQQQRDAIIGQIVSDVRREFDHRNKADDLELSARGGAEAISKAFGLEGPSIIVDAACASSLQALALASRALGSGTIDMALVGGASFCKCDSLILFSAARSVVEGKSRPFDEEANGLVTSEGHVMLVLKTLSAAIATGDKIRSVIRGIGVSSDGKGKSLWAPLKTGQKLAIDRAYRGVVRFQDVQYIDAHATSTQVGDATELSALSESLPDTLPNGKRIA